MVDNHGATVDHFRTKSQAEYHRHSGPAAARWHQRTDWYLGYDLHSRTLTGPERLIIADITDRIAAAANAFQRATIIRPARFRDQAVDDDRIWDAAELANGRYQVRGDNFHTYTAGDFDFLDGHAVTATTDLTAFLRDLLATADLRCTA
ncbi:hypothetical protein AWB97_24580 [Mycobacterium intracellulare subsp. chimaera]|nr:hypothetical protein AWB97_24580 [Mycobacterium intracellulare subsp. chimaera]